ncbi:MAG: hypothetical protein GY861_09370 [bacterium]|nr:hypothetical protein [bacterium]
MKNILEYTNQILKNDTMDLDEFKERLLKEFNNLQLIDVIIRKGLQDNNLEIENDTVNLLKEFDYKKSQSSVDICFSIPPFEKVALETILKTKRVNLVTIEDSFKHLINISKNKIKISSPFFELSGWNVLEKDFIKFMEFGGKIFILCRGKEINSSDNRCIAIKKLLQKVRDLGFQNNIEFREYHYANKQKNKKGYIKSSTHAKLFISDKEEAYVGSGEIRKNSFDINFEMGVLIKGDLVKDIEGVFDLMFESSKKIV